MKSRLMIAAATGALVVALALLPETAMAQNAPAAPAPAASSAALSGDALDRTIAYFANDSVLPFRAPDFTKVPDAAYLPAFEKAMAIHDAEIARIKANPEAPTFENTIVALETSGRMLGRVATMFFALTGANTNDTLDDTQTVIGPKLSQHGDAITLDPVLFARVKQVWDNRAALSLTPEQAKLLEETYEGMVNAGAQLTDAEKEQVKAINAELSKVTTEFSQRVRAATVANALVVDSAAELAGLSQADIDAAAKLAVERGMPGKYVIALQNTTQQPLLPSLENRDVREKLLKLSLTRAEQGDKNDTRELIARIVNLRAQKAALFGHDSWGSYALVDRMAKKPETAIGFMTRMVPALAATQEREAALLNQMIAAEGGNHTVEPWDWYRYANKVKAERYQLDEDKVMEYFQLDKVLEDGVFHAANQLYGLTFRKRTDLPVYHPDVTTWSVFDRDGSELAIFYFDPFQRPSKRGGAWMGNFVDQSHLYGTKPVIYNVLNIPKAAEGEVQLVSFDNVNTLFHEFGHALHGLFADQQYASLSGTATARDFVEYPSQVNEMWATWPSILANYAKHYKTGETIPAELIEKIDAASKFNQGYDFGEVVAAALLDMKWHALSAEEAAKIRTAADVDAFERRALEELGLKVDLVPPRYRSNYFNHIFSSPSGYSAGYYSYLWTEMLDRDSRKWFRDNGGLTRANGDHYRATVMSRGGTMDYFEMFENFAGRQPDVTPMLEARGLTGDTIAPSGEPIMEAAAE